MQETFETAETSDAPSVTRSFNKTSHAPLSGLPLVFRGLLFVCPALLAVVAFGAFVWTFWVALSAGMRAAGWGEQSGVVVPGALAAVAACSVLYLASDRIAFSGGTRLQAQLLRKATNILPAPLPEARFFVEAYADKGRLRLDSDMGWLFVYADYLVFLGDRQTLTIPRARVAEPPQIDRNPLGLAAAWITLPLAPPWGRLRLLGRDNARRASDTCQTATLLQHALNDWMQA